MGQHLFKESQSLPTCPVRPHIQRHQQRTKSCRFQEKTQLNSPITDYYYFFWEPPLFALVFPVLLSPKKPSLKKGNYRFPEIPQGLRWGFIGRCLVTAAVRSENFSSFNISASLCSYQLGKAIWQDLWSNRSPAVPRSRDVSSCPHAPAAAVLCRWLWTKSHGVMLNAKKKIKNKKWKEQNKISQKLPEQ